LLIGLIDQISIYDKLSIELLPIGFNQCEGKQEGEKDFMHFESVFGKRYP
jgi:hypothetical protein